MTPASIRIVVVFPAPSGPTRQKISPGTTAKRRRSTAVTPANLLLSPSTAIAGADSTIGACRREVDRRVSRHPGLQIVRRVLDIDPDAVDERHTLGMCLDALRRELGLRRDERDVAG